MVGIDLPFAQEQLTAWQAASLAVAAGQSYSVGTRALTRVNAQEIRQQIAYWNGLVQKLSAGSGLRVHLGVPND